MPQGSERYEVLRKTCDRWLPKPLPDLPKGTALIGTLQGIVRFRDDWTPEFLPPRGSLLRVSVRAPLTPYLLLTLRPVFEQLGVPWAKPRVGTLPIIFLLMIVYIVAMLASVG